jgi:hypothetical protein
MQSDIKKFAKSMKLVNLFILKRLYDATDSRHNIGTSAKLFPASPSRKIHFNKIDSAGFVLRSTKNT